MEKQEFKEILIKGCSKIEINITQRQIDQFWDYMKFLLEWNEKINLTAITDEKEVILKHFIDCITVSKYIENSKCLVDVGTGAGFPGIPLKIIKDDLHVTLLDSLNKRINFLNQLIEKLQLQNITTFHSRVEEFGKNNKFRESFDYATSRAVANMSTLSEYMLPLVKKGGFSICMKGPDIEEELKSAKKAINVLGGNVKRVEAFELPDSNIKRSVVIIEKIDNTPLKYPRKPGMATKEPI